MEKKFLALPVTVLAAGAVWATQPEVMKLEAETYDDQTKTICLPKVEASYQGVLIPGTVIDYQNRPVATEISLTDCNDKSFRLRVGGATDEMGCAKPIA